MAAPLIHAHSHLFRTRKGLVRPIYKGGKVALLGEKPNNDDAGSYMEVDQSVLCRHKGSNSFVVPRNLSTLVILRTANAS